MFAAVLSGLCIIFPALMGVWMVFIPRSPEYLVTRGDVAGARQSLQWFRGGADVQGELEEIQTMVEGRRRLGSVSLRALVTEARYAKPLGLVLVLMLLQQLSGINYILGYSTTIMKVAMSLFVLYCTVLTV